MKTVPLDPTLCTDELAERIKGRCEVAGDCWLWTGAALPKGYGRVKVPRGRVAYTHRVMWAWANGRDPGDLVIDHLCRNPACCNPAHLEAVTVRVNLLRGDTVTARNAAKTHCPAGHPYEAGNLERHFLRKGQRLCVACARARHRARYGSVQAS